MAKTEPQDVDTAEAGDAPLIDLNDASIKKLIARAKKRGIVTYDELNEALPQDQMSSEQIEDIMSALNDMGVNIVESDDGEEDDQPEIDSGPDEAREGEIAIAKRIEAGRDTMIWGLCESPITFNAIIDWSNALNDGRMQLREIIDLEAMLSKGPTAEQLAQTEEGGEGAEGEISEKVAGPSIKEEDEDMVERRARPEAEADDDEDNTLSLAQMEETLKPQALEKFAEITAIFKKFSKVQEARMEALAAAQ